VGGADCNNSHFALNNPCRMSNGQYWCCFANALASSPWTSSTRKWFEILHQTPPHVCLPYVYLMSWGVSPRPSPLCLQTAVINTAWEQG